MRISEFEIDWYGPLRDVSRDCTGGLEVYYGPNESGKTLLLEALLKLLDPDIEDVMPELDRVDGSPQGYAILETADGEQPLGDGNVLQDFAPVGSMHLRNIFVVRDSDLHLENHHRFYDSVTEQIGDLHTSEIEAIQDTVEDLGRLTPKTRKVSSDNRYDDAGSVRDEAQSLGAEIRDYVHEARREDLDELESELIQTRTERRRVERELAEQEAAETSANYERLAGRLSTVEQTTDELDELSEVSRDEFEELQRLQQEIDSDQERVDTLAAKIEDLESTIDETESELGAAEDERQPMADREGAVEDLAQELESYRQKADQSAGAERSMRMARLLAGLGVGLGGLAALWGVIQGTGQLLPALLVLGVGLVGVGWYVLSKRTLTKLERARESVLRTARDVGFEVDSVSEIPPAIGAYRDELETARQRIQRLENDIRVDEDRLADFQSELDECRDSLRDNRDRRDELLRDAGVTDIQEYREHFERKEDLEQERASAVQSLVDAFGAPNTDEEEERIEYWHDELRDLVAGVDLDAVDPSDYDEARHEELESEVERLETEVAELREKLEDHRRTIDAFASSARDIDMRPFVDEQVTLQAESTDGLERLADDLEQVAERIDRDAEISRQALRIFDELHETEEEKITDLFEPDGRATEVFSRITGGRYDRVSYDPDERTLQVHREGGEVHTTSELSHGTREQLYLSARVALAEKLLDTEPGFFLMDDAFLPADRERLSEGFRVLQDLADEGWQILYLTAKEEVGVDMVDEFGLERWELNPLP